MRPLRHTVVVLVLAGLLAACGGGSSASTDRPEGEALGEVETSTPTLPVTVRSADGRSVEVTDVSRIVPLVGSISEVVFELGLGANVVARDISATFAEAAHLPLVTRAHDVSAESVLSLRPTLVLADPDTGPPEALDHIRNVGVPVVVVEKARKVAGIGDRIETIAEILGVPDAGERLRAATEAELEEATAAVPGDEDPPRIAFLYLRGQSAVYLLGGPGAGTDSIIEAVGGVDAGKEMGLTEAFTPITSEAMVEAAPDVLLMTTTGLESVGGVDGLVEIPGIAQTPAGRNRRIVTLEDGLLFSFGSRTPEAIRSIVEQLYG